MRFTITTPLNKEIIELFCGAAEVTRAFKELGFASFTVDKRNRKGKCVPDLCADILKINAAVFPFQSPGVIWAAVPCDAYSNAAGNYYRDGTGYKESTKYFNSMLRKTLNLIEEMLAKQESNRHLIYFIENPRASLRYNKLMIDFLARTSGTVKECTLGSYGFPTTKPTDIFTNYAALTLKEKLPYGRGAKCAGQSFNNLTKAQRQSTPFELGLDIAYQLCNHYWPPKRTWMLNPSNFQHYLEYVKKTTSLEANTPTIKMRAI